LAELEAVETITCQLVAFLVQQAPLPDRRQISERADGVTAARDWFIP
jgi:hypothetical protein